MTTPLLASEVVNQIKERFPAAAAEAGDGAVLIKAESVFEVIKYLKSRPELDLDYFNYITAVDYYDYLEVIYQLTSLKHNHSLVLKTRCYSRESPKVPSIVSLYRGADFQEREIYDLMGISFTGHPNLKRIFLWEGFAGHPLRKDYL